MQTFSLSLPSHQCHNYILLSPLDDKCDRLSSSHNSTDPQLMANCKCILFNSSLGAPLHHFETLLTLLLEHFSPRMFSHKFLSPSEQNFALFSSQVLSSSTCTCSKNQLVSKQKGTYLSGRTLLLHFLPAAITKSRRNVAPTVRRSSRPVLLQPF